MPRCRRESEHSWIPESPKRALVFHSRPSPARGRLSGKRGESKIPKKCQSPPVFSGAGILRAAIPVTYRLGLVSGKTAVSEDTGSLGSSNKNCSVTLRSVTFLNSIHSVKKKKVCPIFRILSVHFLPKDFVPVLPENGLGMFWILDVFTPAMSRFLESPPPLQSFSFPKDLPVDVP